MTLSSAKKRKASTLLESDASSPTTTQSHITSYARLSKAQALLASKSLEKGLDAKPHPAVATVISSSSGDKKEEATPARKRRKRDAVLGLRAAEEATTQIEPEIEPEHAEVGESPTQDASKRVESSPERPTPKKRTRERLGTSPIKATVTSSPSKPRRSTVDRGQSLLERVCHSSPHSTTMSLLNKPIQIRAKERQQALLPAGPSDAELERRAALERLFEIIPVLNFLTLRHQSTLKTPSSITTTTNLAFEPATASAPKALPPPQKFSAPLPMVVQHLQTSLRNPLARDEAERCIDLLAREIAPDWCQHVAVGKIKAVVLRRGRCPSVLEIKERVGLALDRRT